MPELPEVETIRRGLARELVGRRIDGVDARPAKLRGTSPRPLGELAGQRIASANRHGKFLLIGLDRGTWLVHLGMTGKLLFAEPGERELPHTHLVLDLDDDRQLRFSDPRRFGALKLFAKDATVPDLQDYGPDALAPDFTPDVLAASLRESSAPMKAFLLDQSRLAGVGNIYACEALWRSGISPRRKARTVPAGKVALLHKSIQDVLRDSLAKGGTSFNDYVNAIGETGKFMAELAVFQREGDECPRCGDVVRRIVQSGRSTFYCGACQR